MFLRLILLIPLATAMVFTPLSVAGSPALEIKLLQNCSRTNARLDAFRRGDFDDLDEYLLRDSFIAKGSILGRLTGSGQDQQTIVIESGYRYWIAMYGLIRVQELGSCGEPVATVGTEVTSTRTMRNLLGQIRSSETTKSSGKDIKVLRKFYSLTMREVRSLNVASGFNKELRAYFRASSCRSSARISIERNMLKYASRTCEKCKSSSYKKRITLCDKVREDRALEKKKKIQSELERWGGILD